MRYFIVPVICIILLSMLLFLGKYTEEEQQETQDSELCTIHSEKAFIIYDESFFYDIIIMEVDKYARKLK